MEIMKHPETEMEYWEIIEYLGGFIFGRNHDLSDERILDPDGLIDISISEAKELQSTLTEELSLKFGVIMPKDCPKFTVGEAVPPAPENKIYYRDWYHKMEKQACEVEYEKIICSTCPFSEGIEGMTSLRGTIPCSVFPGVINHLARPFNCAMISSDSWDEVELYDKVIEASGKEGLVKFLEKEMALKKIYLKESNSNEV